MPLQRVLPGPFRLAFANTRCLTALAKPGFIVPAYLSAPPTLLWETAACEHVKPTRRGTPPRRGGWQRRVFSILSQEGETNGSTKDTEVRTGSGHAEVPWRFRHRELPGQRRRGEGRATPALERRSPIKRGPASTSRSPKVSRSADSSSRSPRVRARRARPAKPSASMPRRPEGGSNAPFLFLTHSAVVSPRKSAQTRSLPRPILGAARANQANRWPTRTSAPVTFPHYGVDTAATLVLT